MIIEFIGSTGAGKTTLIREIRESLRQSAPEEGQGTARVATSIEFVTGLVGLRRVSSPTLQNLIIELVSLPFFLIGLPRYGAFVTRTLKLAGRGKRFSLGSVIEFINNFRSLERKIGVYEIARRLGHAWIILVDEGPVLAAHMLTYHGANYTPDEISALARSLPLPDLIVYIHAPVELLVTRTLRRSDPPRALRGRDPAQIERCTRDTVAMFDAICSDAEIRSRLCLVENGDGETQVRGCAVETVIGRIFIHAAQPADEDVVEREFALRSGGVMK